MKNSNKVILLVLLILIIDQVLKIWVKTNMHIGEDSLEHWETWTISWARIHFVENEGMAFGLTLGGTYGKLFLSLFRIIAVAFLIYYIRLLDRAKASFGLLSCFALILAGAIGNIIDSAFYGLIFSDSPYHTRAVAELFPDGGGYAGFLMGNVVDMLYFPIHDGFYPDWFPFVGGKSFLFFRPVFNIADSAITIGVISLLLFHRSFFSGKTPLDKGANGQQPESPEMVEPAIEQSVLDQNGIPDSRNADEEIDSIESEIKRSLENPGDEPPMPT